MTNNDKSNHDSQSITDLFHRVERLIPSHGKPVTVRPNTPVAEAVALMKGHNYSQLPVVAGEEVLGVFSFRSLTTRLIEMGQMREYFGDLPVDEFMEDFRFVQPSDNWESLLDYLERDDGVLIGQRDDLGGIVTTMDLLRYLHNQASPFVVLREIELSLRQIIYACVNKDELQVCIRNSLKGKYGEDVMPSDLLEMTLNDYIQIIGDGRNWPHFEVVFGKGAWQRKTTRSRLEEVRDLRNDIFHFRRQITDADYDILKKHRKWLQTKARAYEAITRLVEVAPEPEVQLQPQPTGQKWDETSFFVKLESHQGAGDVAVARDILEWARSSVTYVWWGEGKRSGSFVPVLNHKDQDHQLFVAWTYGKVEIYFYWYQYKAPFNTEEKRLELLKRLNTLPGVSIPRAAIAKRPTFPLAVLKEKTSRQQFLTIFDWVVQEIQLDGGPSETTQPDKPLAKRHIMRLDFWRQLLEHAKEKTNLHARISPSKDSWISATSGRRGFRYTYIIRMNDAQVELAIDTPENKQLFDALASHKAEIEQIFGVSLAWNRADDRKSSKICYKIPGGGLANQEQWPKIQERMIDAMIRLEIAFRPHIQPL